MGIVVKSGGLLTTVQDAGRFGYQQFGVSASGAVDRRSLAIANHLVGNSPDEAALEATLSGPCLEFTETAVVAITGGDLTPLLNGSPAEMYRALYVENGSLLSLGGARSGCRAYLAVAGGLELPLEMGSRSTDIKAKLGGFRGRKLEQGDELGLRSPGLVPPEMPRRAVSPDDFSGGEVVLRVVMGPQDDAFTPEGIETFLRTVYTVTTEFDRMGCRLDGEAIRHLGDGNIISDGISFGAVQVPTEGKPILMLADRQTTGGYAKIANVVTADFSKMAQLKAKDRLRFQKIGIDEAQELYLAEGEALAAMRSALDAPPPATPPTQGRLFEIRVAGAVYQVTIQENP